MPLYSYLNWRPEIGKDCFIAPSAELIGQVFVGDKASVWFQTLVRADINYIKIGEETNVQDHCILHVSRDYPLIIGSHNSIGHNVTLHACKIGNHSLIGMGATILDGAEIGDNSLVAAGTLVPPGKKFPPHSFIIGSPAILKRELNEKEKEEYGKHYLHYEEVRNNFRNHFELC